MFNWRFFTRFTGNWISFLACCYISYFVVEWGVCVNLLGINLKLIGLRSSYKGKCAFKQSADILFPAVNRAGLIAAVINLFNRLRPFWIGHRSKALAIGH